MRLELDRIARIACVIASMSSFASAGPATTQSTPVEKDGVAVTLASTRPTVDADAQPTFVVRFTNYSADYINLYDVDAYWHWEIDFANVDPHALEPGPWRLRLDDNGHAPLLAHRQIKPGEQTEVLIDLNDPPFTFQYVYAGPAERAVAPHRGLPSGTYAVTVTPRMTPPFGPGYHEWTGPVTSDPIRITIDRPRTRSAATQHEREYDAIIDRVVARLDPHGLWLNGGYPKIDLPADASPADVIATAVNGSSLGSKAYRILRVRTLDRPDKMSAALVRIGATPGTASTKVLVFFPQPDRGWWSRFYDADFETSATRPD